MKRFLVVGCGGSGGATLAYLMDQLRSDLAAHGVHGLPPGWQFLQIDVPSACDSAPDGLGNVEQQGGSYFGCGPQGASYAVLDDAVSRRFSGTESFDAIGTWAPREPDKVNIPMSVGAGQYRAVGRMISLSRATAIRQTLQSAWARLNHPDTAMAMAELRVPGLGDYDRSAPIVLVVSSMAGGAGASMALDVCRLLTMVPNVDANLMGVFMVAPNIFDTLPEAARAGVRPNALAMLGEIVASQTGAARDHDVATLQAVGQPGGAGVPIPFARVFPVGCFSGIERTQFGDGTPEAVYRGLGRGLAGLMMSAKATQQFVHYDLANTLSPPGNRDLLGWGAEWDKLPWGSYGFASLSMGRDRYSEYAAQRIARSCVERLLTGHMQPGSRAASTEQVAALLDSQWDGVCRRAGLPPTAVEVDGWLQGYAFPATVVAEKATEVVETGLRDLVPNPGGMQAAQWVPALRHRLAAQSPVLAAAAERAAVGLVFAWHQKLVEEVEREVAGTIAQLGLPYAVAVVERLARHVRDTVAPGGDRAAGMAGPDVAAVPRELEPTLSRLRGAIANGTQIVENLLTGCRKNVKSYIDARSAHLAATVLRQFSVDVLAPMAEALSEAQRTIESALGTKAVHLGLARLATDHCVAWPSDDDHRVSDRFEEADNEVLLTSSRDFQPQYVSDLRRAVRGGRNPLFEDARKAVVQDVVSGMWVTTGGKRPPGGLLERRAEWRPRAFAVDPSTGSPLIPSLARYDVHVRPAELLRRARMFAERPGESFDQFCRVSITDFVGGAGAAESEREGRGQEVVIKFTQALTLARPLVSVDNTALQAVHGADIEYRYKFSEVPFKGTPTGDALLRVLSTDPMIDQASAQNIESSLGNTAGVTRIDIFGSYPNYSPLVFDAVLGPVAEQWAATTEQSRESFWQWRRARPLDASLPMGTDERRTMIAGWLLGRIVGRISIPAAPFTQPVRIWDAEHVGWVPFPHPLLTPPRRFKAEYDWLPAVLESVLLAIAKAHEEPVMASLRPYGLLRAMYDASEQSPAQGPLGDLSARDLVADWLAGRLTGGESSAVPGVTVASSVDERAKLATEWLTKNRTLAGTHYMAPGVDRAPGGGTFSVVRSRAYAAATPMFRDVAPDVFWATGQLITVLETALEAAHAPVGLHGVDSPALPPHAEIVVPPSGAV